MNQRICWLEDIFVEESERGKGIGRKLISQMAKEGSLVLVQHQAVTNSPQQWLKATHDL